ncbi:uncharacterized protein LOC133871869 [Alnus glutinosa]|uniref:uncharacterized protein LOC133871869 n=1 Tax=Alnus glutinosa TaxID=3517 RepID=UPI002D79865C|nr:uncharacterized protein LOC133871869 [Alnus glutinosa]
MNPNPIDMKPNSNSTILNPKDEPGATKLNDNASATLNRGVQPRQKLVVRLRQKGLEVKWLAGIVCSLGRGIDTFFIEMKDGKPILTMEGDAMDTKEIVLKLHQTCGGVDGCSYSCGREEFTLCLSFIELADVQELESLMSVMTRKN